LCGCDSWRRRDELDRQIEALALTPALVAAVGVLQSFRGLKVHSAMVLATELVDWRRFETPGQLMAYLGLVPREDSTGARERKGSITKAGNRHCRHVLVQAAWTYRHNSISTCRTGKRHRSQPSRSRVNWQAFSGRLCATSSHSRSRSSRPRRIVVGENQWSARGTTGELSMGVMG
jgi:transposase